MVLSSSFVFNSCSKEEYFDGQTWKGEKFDLPENSGELQITLTFTGNQVSAKMKYTYKDDYDSESYSITAKGTYTYEKKKVRMNVESKDWDIDDTWSGKVDKERMTLNVVMNEMGLDEQVVFTKQ